MSKPKVEQGGFAFPVSSFALEQGLAFIGELPLPVAKVEEGQAAYAAACAGMTLRQYYAGQSITSWLPGSYQHFSDEEIEGYAKQAFRLADAMVKIGGVS